MIDFLYKAEFLLFCLEGGYEDGVDPFVSGDLEINNEVYNNPGVMVG